MVCACPQQRWEGQSTGLAKLEQPILAPIATGTLRQLPLARPAYTHIVLETYPCVIRLLCAVQSFVLLKQRQRI